MKKLCKTSLNIRTPLHLFSRDRSVSWTNTFCSWLQFLTIYLPVIFSIPEPYSLTQPERLTLFRQGQRRSKSCFLSQSQVLGCWLALALCIASSTLLLHEVFSHFIAMDNPPKSVSSFHLLCSSIKLWTVQKVSGLHWEHLSKLQTEDFILKSAFTYMWVTMVVKSLQSNNAIS